MTQVIYVSSFPYLSLHLVLFNCSYSDNIQTFYFILFHRILFYFYSGTIHKSVDIRVSYTLLLDVSLIEPQYFFYSFVWILLCTHRRLGRIPCWLMTGHVVRTHRKVVSSLYKHPVHTEDTTAQLRPFRFAFTSSGRENTGTSTH